MAENRRGLTYAQAGVDIDAGNRMVELIKPWCGQRRGPAPIPRSAALAEFSILSRPATEIPFLSQQRTVLARNSKLPLKPAGMTPSVSIWLQ